jgi:hemoglobin-like flavoprotein
MEGMTRMDSENIGLVQASLERILPHLDEVTGLFFQRLSELDPLLRFVSRGAWGGDAQVGALVPRVVMDLATMERASPTLDRLGERLSHAVIEQHYLTVGAALLWALEQTLCDLFTPAVRLAWMEAYTSVVARVQSVTTAHRSMGYVV